MKQYPWLLALCILCMCSTRQVLIPLDAEDEFERGQTLFENKKYDSAAQSFERILFYHPSSEYVDDAQYWLGRSYFAQKEYDQAIIEFEYLIKNFSTSRFVEETYLFRARAYLAKAPGYHKDPTQIEQAIELFNDFLTRFPNSQHTDEVKELILGARDCLARKEMENGITYSKLGERDAALLYFSYVIETYPETEASLEAKYRAAEIYEIKEQYQEAAELYQELLQEEHWKAKAQKRMNALAGQVGEAPQPEDEN